MLKKVNNITIYGDKGNSSLNLLLDKSKFTNVDDNL